MMEDFKDLMQEATDQFENGGGGFLLTGEAGKAENVMTISWGQWGIVWFKPACTILVRKGRHSYRFLKNGTFTISIPQNGAMREELAFCGSKSGRDCDKFKELGLKTMPPRACGVEALEGCSLHFECRVMATAPMDLESLEPQLRVRCGYDGENPDTLHEIFFAEIVAAYRS